MCLGRSNQSCLYAESAPTQDQNCDLYNTSNDIPSKIVIMSGWRSLMKMRSSLIALSLIASVAAMLIVADFVCAQAL